MTAAKYVKKNGLKSLSQVAEVTGVPRNTLDSWHKNKPELFETVVLGCVFKLKFGGQYKAAMEVFENGSH